MSNGTDGVAGADTGCRPPEGHPRGRGLVLLPPVGGCRCLVILWQPREPTLRLSSPRVLDPSPDCQRLRERAAGAREVTLSEVRLTPDLCRFCFTPCIAAGWSGRQIERLPGRLDRLDWVRPGQSNASDGAYYDTERAHTGRLTEGRTPYETLVGASKMRPR